MIFSGFLVVRAREQQEQPTLRKMILEEQMVTDVSTYNEPRLDPGAFWLTFELTKGVEPAAVEACLRAELKSIAEDGLTEDEIRRARTQLESSFMFEEETALGSAMKIGRFEAQCVGGYRRLADAEEVYATVDSAAVQKVVKRYFAPETFNIVYSLPTDAVNGSARPGEPSHA